MTRLPVSALITTFNEVDQIEECIESALWADEIWVVDSFSTDGTVDIIREKFPQVRVEQHTYHGAASQKNYTIDRAANDWVLFIDADERVTPGLRDEVSRLLESAPGYWGYSIGRRNFMLGKEVRYSGLQRDRVTRLFNRRNARYPNRRVHTDLVVNGPVGKLNEKFLHYYIRSFDHMIEKMTRYGMWGATQLYMEGRRTSSWGIFSHSMAKFFRDYVINLGFLDGTAGLISVGMHVYYTFWKYSKLWEFTRLETLGLPLPLPPMDENQDRWAMPWETATAANVDPDSAQSS